MYVGVRVLLLVSCLLSVPVPRLSAVDFIPSVLHSDWVLASTDTLQQRYFAYERCVLAAPELYNLSESVHEQSRCEHFVDEALKQLPKRCWLGSKQQLGNEGTCFGKGCLPLSMRPGFTMHYRNLGTPLHNDSDGSLGFEADVVVMAQQLFFDVMIFTGDSMAVQVSRPISSS